MEGSFFVAPAKFFMTLSFVGTHANPLAAPPEDLPVSDRAMSSRESRQSAPSTSPLIDARRCSDSGIHRRPTSLLGQLYSPIGRPILRETYLR
jgi:hypothetical protein